MNYKQQRHKFIISGGGTGGHIFPAIAIANALKTKTGDADILFVGATGKMEMEKVPAAGYPIEGLWISGIQRRLTLQNLLFPFKLLSSLQKAKRIIRKFQPEVVIGVGGFASGPTLQVAASRKIPTVIQEQNSFPGITNKILASKVTKICVAYDNMEKYFPAEKIIYTGNPIRKEVVQIKSKKEEAASFFGLSAEKTTLLIIGGSQGSLAINRSIAKILERLINNNLQVIWQTGKFFAAEAKKISVDLKSNLLYTTEFIDRMDLAYSMADIIVSRAGAIAISEISSVGKPPIFVPLPSAAEDHQTKNAQALVDKKAAILINQKEIDSKLEDTILKLYRDRSIREEFSKNLIKLAVNDSAGLIAEEILNLVKSTHS